MHTGDRRDRSRGDPPPAFRFRVEIDGVPLAAFRECLGLAGRTEVFEIREGGVNDRTHLRPGRTTFTPITLRRGLGLDPALWEWRRDVIDGRETSVRTGDIVLGDDRGAEVMRWTFLDGWPSRWEGPVLAAGCSAVALEAIEIVHEGLRLAIA